MSTKKAREFWLNDIDVCYTVFKSKKDATKPALRMGTKETIHVREVLPNEITDTDRLNYMIECQGMWSRKAIDSTMKRNKKLIKLEDRLERAEEVIKKIGNQGFFASQTRGNDLLMLLDENTDLA